MFCLLYIQSFLYLLSFQTVLCVFYSVMRRVVTLLSQVAATLEDSVGLQAQAENALQAAEKQQEENQKLKTVRIRDSRSCATQFLSFRLV